MKPELTLTLEAPEGCDQIMTGKHLNSLGLKPTDCELLYYRDTQGCWEECNTTGDRFWNPAIFALKLKPHTVEIPRPEPGMYWAQRLANRWKDDNAILLVQFPVVEGLASK